MGTAGQECSWLSLEVPCPCPNQSRVLTVPDQMVLRQYQASHYTNAAQVIEGDYSAEICLVTHQGEVDSNSQICTLLCEA